MDFSLDFKEKEIRDLTINVTDLFKKNIYIHFEKIKLSKIVSISGGKIVFVNLEKEEGKKKLLKV
ncbi:hypothetical protein JCM9492_03060 [Aquifex pyrophilus]